MKIIMTRAEAQEFIRCNLPTSVNAEAVEILEVQPVSLPVTPPMTSVNPVLLANLRYAAQRNDKIAMIKALRSMTGWGLKDSKDVVEAFFERRF